MGISLTIVREERIEDGFGEGGQPRKPNKQLAFCRSLLYRTVSLGVEEITIEHGRRSEHGVGGFKIDPCHSHPARQSIKPLTEVVLI